MFDTYGDDDLTLFAAQGTPPLPPGRAGTVVHEGASVWFADMGAGEPIILLHGGLGHSGNFAYQAPAIVEQGFRVIAIDSRGHGRSTRDDQAYSYELMARDVLAVMDHLAIAQAMLTGWSDGACTSLILADRNPERVRGVVYFACNMDPSGTLPFVATPVIDRCFARHKADYAVLSSTPDNFATLVEAVGLMQRTQPDYSAADLARISVPVAVLHAAGDEFIRAEHVHYFAQTIPGASFEELSGVAHFAPLQRPALFNSAVLRALASFED